jgi:hypothetical protein
MERDWQHLSQHQTERRRIPELERKRGRRSVAWALILILI